MKPVVAINNPCHESWEKMTPQEQGRHCDQCCKIVVDFTKMSNKAIAKYLEQRQDQKVCGRFRAVQVGGLPKSKIPARLWHSGGRFSFNIQRFAAAVFLAFGSFLFASCSSSKPHEHELMGDVAYIPDTIVKTQNNDTTGLSKLISPVEPQCVIPDKEDVYVLGRDIEVLPEQENKK